MKLAFFLSIVSLPKVTSYLQLENIDIANNVTTIRNKNFP